jgi:hypothetical protein
MVKQIPVCVVLGFVVLTAACGGGGSASPASPGAAAVNVTGTWVDGGGLTMQLVQTGAAVTGTSTFLDKNAVFGSYQGSGTVSGTVAGSQLTTTELYQLTSSTGEALASCVESVTSTMTIVSDKQMGGPFAQTDTCNGTVVFSKSRSATLTRP